MNDMRDPSEVREKLQNSLTTVEIGPYEVRRKFEDMNANTVLLRRRGMKADNTVDMTSDYFESLVETYGASPKEN